MGAAGAQGCYELQMICVYCDEVIAEGEELAEGVFMTVEGPRQGHRECALREVLGGIGHLIAHEWWCKVQHDPDAGLSRRQSAQLAWTWQRVVGL